MWRGERKLGEGHILNLQTGKEDVKSVDEGVEAGMLVESSATIEKGMVLRFEGN